jgi:hypothetical protein
VGIGGTLRYLKGKLPLEKKKESWRIPCFILSLTPPKYMKDFLVLCNCSRRIRTKECHQQKQGDICYEMHTSGDNGSLAVEMLSLAYVRDIPCKLETNREREDHPTELHTSQGKTHIGCH